MLKCTAAKSKSRGLYKDLRLRHKSPGSEALIWYHVTVIYTPCQRLFLHYCDIQWIYLRCLDKKSSRSSVCVMDSPANIRSWKCRVLYQFSPWLVYAQHKTESLTSRGCHVFRVFKLPDFWGTEPERWAQKERSSNVRYCQGNTRASRQVLSSLSEKCQACFPAWPDFRGNLLHVCVLCGPVCRELFLSTSCVSADLKASGHGTTYYGNAEAFISLN